MVEHEYKLAEDEKVTAVMAYTNTSIYWGDAITKKAIRVGGWMRSDFSPLILELRNAHVLIFGGPTPISLHYKNIYLPYESLVAFDVMPGVKEDLYYDATEKKRLMLPVSAFVGAFRFDGKFRLSSMTSVLRTLEVAKEDFMPLYEVEASHPGLPVGSVVKIDYVTVKRSLAVWSIPDSPERDELGKNG